MLLLWINLFFKCAETPTENNSEFPRKTELAETKCKSRSLLLSYTTVLLDSFSQNEAVGSEILLFYDRRLVEVARSERRVDKRNGTKTEE
jgi:hypothetical protein